MKRILVIEDDTELQKVLGLSLSNAGYAVHAALNGKEGYEKVGTLHPDLVLLDLMLPVLPGIDVLKKMAEDPKLRGIPVIVMTAYGDPEGILERMVLAAGARDYIEKPFRLRDILALIRNNLRKYCLEV